MLKRLSCLLAVIMSGCAVPPARDIGADVAQVQQQLPSKWTWQNEDTNPDDKIQTQTTRPLPQKPWWTHYQNSELNQLVNQAMTNNLSLQTAKLMITQAKLQADEQNTQRNVKFSGNLGANLNAALREGADVQQSYSGGVNASYLFDFWDKLQLNANKSAAEIAATEEDWHAAELAIAGAVVQRYLHIAYLNEQLRLNQAQLRNAERNAQFTQAKVDAGTAAKLELLQAQAPITDLKATRTQLENDKKQQLTALGVILGRAQPADVNPQDLSAFTFALPAAGVPAAILARRPDLRAEQLRLQQTLTGVTIAERNFYPSISLGGNLGFSAEKLWRILQNPTAALTGSLDLPFLHYQDQVLAQKQAELSYQQALKRFQQKLLDVLSEVQQALLSLTQAEKDEAFAVNKAKQTAEIARLEKIRYDAGAVSLQDLLNSQQNHRDSEAAILRARYEKLLRSVNLFLALGGDLQAAE